jgi:phospholipase/carboxylesterase
MFAHPLRVGVSAGSALLVLLLLGACATDDGLAPSTPDGFDATRGDLNVTFRTPSQAAVPGLQSLQRGGRRFSVYVPSSYTEERSWPVALLLHGSDDRGATIVNALAAHAEQAGVVLIAPDAARYTWDLILGNVGPDAAYIEQLLDWAFDNISVDPTRLTLGGFSDGASYTAWLGLLNGDIFPQLLIMSGCSRFPDVRVGKPRILMMHGNADRVFGVNSCVSLLLPGLELAGYDVEFIQFEGGHVVSQEFAPRAMAFVAGQ